MFRRNVTIICAVLCLVAFAAIAHAQLPQISSGLSYLSSSQNPDGTWQSSTAQVETTAATVSVLETLKLLNQTAGNSYTSGSSWLLGQTPKTVDYIAERVHALSLADGSVNALIPALDALMGAWGGYGGFFTNPLDSSFALQALKTANYSDLTVINNALSYFTSNQNPDGGWGFPSTGSGQAVSNSNVYITAIVSATLQQFPQMTTIATAVNKATTYLLAQQSADGGFGSVYETALAYSALVAVTTDSAALANAINYLTATQSANGSWNDDPYSTALALKALYLSENRPSPPPPPPAGGRITGTVIDKITVQNVAGVAVVLDSNNLINTTTDASGSFTLSDIPAGVQKVNFTLTGYAATSATATVAVDTTVNLGTIPMTSAATTGTIAGTISDSTGKPLSGVAITISGAWSGSATTGADGTYSFSYVTPGTVTISAAKTGFQPVTANGTVYARTTLTFSPRLSTTASQVTTGTLVGRVVDSYWGVPIGHLPEEKGVRVLVPGLAEVPVEPEGGGYFSIPDLAPGTYQVIVGMLSFQTFRVVITPGGVTDLGTIRLDMSIVMTLTGKITDASTGAPIAGAEVTFEGKDLTGRTDSTGTYAIADIPSYEQFTIKASAEGYVGKSYTIGSTKGLQTMDISLSPKLTKGSLTGTVVDAATGQPLAGATLTLTSDSSISAATDTSGAFTMNNIPKGRQQVTITLNGYTSRTLIMRIIAGAVVNAGKLALGAAELPATIQGRVTKTGDQPFEGVTIAASGTGSFQAVTATDGSYTIDAVAPGTVTVSATALNNPEFTNARLSEIIEPGGILLFSPTLGTTVPGTLDLSIHTGKPLYGVAETVSITTNLRNRETEEMTVALHLRVIAPGGSNIYETSTSVAIAADGSLSQPFSFILPATAASGRYTIYTEAHDANGAMLNNSYGYFNVSVSQITVSSLLPATFTAGDNTISFNLTNSGTLPVSTGTMAVTLKDPDGQVVSTAVQNFSLGLGANATIAVNLPIPTLKFGTYTLSYLQSDETKPGQATDIALPNTMAVTALYDDASHRIRGTANLTVTLCSTGRFNINNTTVTAAVPDAAYSETKTLADGTGALLYQFAIPETMTAGQHGTRITVTLPSGSTTVQTAQLTIMESLLNLAPIQGTFTAGSSITPVINNSGGVDTQVQYRLSLYDAKAALIAETVNTGTAPAGSTLSPTITIPLGAVDGSYNLVVTFKDGKTGKEASVPNGITINGVKGSLQVQTDKVNYLLTEDITGFSGMTNSGTDLQNGNLHLQVTTGPGVQKTKTWTTQADFQTGMRNGVDTYGVNDWIIPDDDFDGTTLDTNKWAAGDGVSIQSGKLWVDTTQTPSSSIVLSKWLLEGDFDIQIDFTSNTGAPYIGAQFGVDFGNYSGISFGNYQSAGYTTVVNINGVRQAYLPNGIYSNSGKFRFTRTGNKVETYYWGGSSWIAANNFTSDYLLAPCLVGMSIYKGAGFPGVSAAFDNFKVNSGRIKTVNQTVDSVRLLPLNDNFDDGVYNDDRWGEYGQLRPVEGAGVLHFTSSTNAAGNGVIHRFSLMGDFQATTKFKNFSVTPTGVDTGRFLFRAYSAGDSGFYINRISSSMARSGGQYITGLSSLNGVYQMGADSVYISNSGLFRLVKTQDQGSDEFWDGAAWRSIHTVKGLPNQPMQIWLYALTQQTMPSTVVDIDSFRVNGGTYAQTGTLCLKQDAGQSVTWRRLYSNSIIPANTSIKFRTRTAETEAGLANATWSEYLTASGSPITSPAAQWIEIESTLTTTDANVTPLLHDVSVTYESIAGETLWQADVPANLAQGALSELNHTIGTLGMTGKFYLEGTLTSSTGQTVATAEYPFYVEQGTIQITLAPDKMIYRPGETVTITGEAKNLSSIAATGLTARVQGAGAVTPYTETFDLPATSTHPFSFTTTAGTSGIYQLSGTVTQNLALLTDIAAQYEVATPVLTATLTTPDSVGNSPFTIALSLTNTGKVSATTNVHIVDDGGNVIGDQLVTVPAGETRMLQYTRQITGNTAYTATISGDLTQTLTKLVAYAVIATDSSVNAKIVTDKVSYNPNEQVTLTSTISANSVRENLSTLVTVSNAQGQALYSATTALPPLMQGLVVTSKNYWNSATYPAGTYLVSLRILEPSGSVIGTATCNLTITSTFTPQTLLKGVISLDKQSILTGEPVQVSYSLTNAGNIDLSDIALTVRTVNLAEEAVYNTTSDQTSLTMGATYTNGAGIDTQGYSAKDYLVVLRATIGGVEETLAGTYFRVEGAPSAPALSGPANGSDVENFAPALMVSNAADPNDDKLTYEFELYADSSLTTLAATSGMTPETTGATGWTVAPALTENQTYFWRARAYDGRLYGSWMAPASFRVNTVNDPPTAPTIASPANGTSVDQLTSTLTINNASDPDSSNLTYNFAIALDPEFTQIVASLTGVASGQGTTSWTTPAALQENVEYYWRAQADDWLVEGPWSATSRFFVNTANDPPTAPVITSPVNGSTITTQSPDAVIGNSSDPDSSSLVYYFEADTAPTFDSVNLIRSTAITEGSGTTLWHLNGLQDNTQYYLRVRASDGTADSPWSAVTAFVVNTVNDPPTTPVLANPSSGAGVSVFTPTLSVHNATDLDKDVLSYEFEIYSDAALTSLATQSGSISEAALITSWTTPTVLTENQTYYWRSRTSDGLLHSGWMPTASFMVNTANDAPGAPQLSAPGDGTTLATLTPSLSVVNAADPDTTRLTYDFEVYNNGVAVDTITAAPEGTAGQTSVTLTKMLADNTTYSWRARAFDGDRYGAWMNMATFTTHIAQAAITAEIEFEPKTLNKKSNGTWVMLEIELPHGYKAADIDVSTIRLNGTVPAELHPTSNRCDGGRDELTVKFRRNSVIAALPPGNHVPVHVTGMVGSTAFEGVCIIRVIK